MKCPEVIYVVITATGEFEGDFQGAFCNESTASDRQLALELTYTGEQFRIVEYSPTTCHQTDLPDPASQQASAQLGR